MTPSKRLAAARERAHKAFIARYSRPPANTDKDQEWIEGYAQAIYECLPDVNEATTEQLGQIVLDCCRVVSNAVPSIVEAAKSIAESNKRMADATDLAMRRDSRRSHSPR